MSRPMPLGCALALAALLLIVFGVAIVRWIDRDKGGVS